MHKYVLKKKFADFMGLEANKPYVEDFIKLIIIEKCFSVADIKKFMPRFKGCSCKQTICQNNSLTFYSYILENYMEEMDIPSSNFYYDPKQKPKEVDIKNFD
jgi:hypothetical protein